MPVYLYECPTCESQREETHGMKENPRIRCACGKNMGRIIASVPRLAGLTADWSTENGGRGRMINQLNKRPGDPYGYCRNREEAVEKAKRRFPEAIVHRD